ncbi:hypothetical protein BC629DRAFT_1565023 [Irpex lacteus]|nr:hypothetical protein BC629DRAFT_1565023 [Irpex lacteus]
MASNATTGLIPDIAAFQDVRALGVVLCALSALFGAYFGIVLLAIWSTFWRSGALYRNLRIVSIGLFTVLPIFYVFRDTIFSKSRTITSWEDLLRVLTIPLSTLAGLSSDGLLIWRPNVGYGWALWLPLGAITLNTYLAGIGYISQSANKDGDHHKTTLLAIVESALVGLLLYGIAFMVPIGGVTQSWNVGFVMVCVIPMFFGIAHWMITARLGSTALNASTACSHAELPFADATPATIFAASKESKGSPEDCDSDTLDKV